MKECKYLLCYFPPKSTSTKGNYETLKISEIEFATDIPEYFPNYINPRKKKVVSLIDKIINLDFEKLTCEDKLIYNKIIKMVYNILLSEDILRIFSQEEKSKLFDNLFKWSSLSQDEISEFGDDYNEFSELAILHEIRNFKRNIKSICRSISTKNVCCYQISHKTKYA